MRNWLRSIYEKNNFSIIYIYFFLKVVYILFGKYKKIKIEVRDAIKNFEGENISRLKYIKIYRKLIVYRYIYLIRPSEYYLYGFENVSYDKRDTYITRSLTKYYYRKINNKKYRKIFDKKNLSYVVFKKYYKRDLICVKDETERDVFEEFIKNKERFILKPFSGHSGYGIEIINISDYENSDELFEYVKDKTPFVAEELIAQSDSMGCFHKESVNTIRVVTFQYNGLCSILWAFLRTGQGDSEVDNMGAAGLGALIDIETGKIISNGFDWLGKEEEKHPDSGIVFKGFQIPKWDELKEMIKELSSEVSQMHCVGWDLALSDDGWVLVEGNARPQCVTIQTFTKKGYRPYFDKMYKLVELEREEEDRIMKGEEL